MNGNIAVCYFDRLLLSIEFGPDDKVTYRIYGLNASNSGEPCERTVSYTRYLTGWMLSGVKFEMHQQMDCHVDNNNNVTLYEHTWLNGQPHLRRIPTYKIEFFHTDHTDHNIFQRIV